MAVTRVATIAEADRGLPHHQLLRRVKYTHASEMLREYRVSNATIQRVNCPVCDYLEAHIDEDVIELEKTIYRHPIWGPSVLMETLIGAPVFNNPSSPEGRFACEAVQHCAALALTEHDWIAARPYIEQVFHHPQMAFFSADALQVLVDHLRANHPNVDEFLAQPTVAATLDRTFFKQER